MPFSMVVSLKKQADKAAQAETKRLENVEDGIKKAAEEVNFS